MLEREIAAPARWPERQWLRSSRHLAIATGLWPQLTMESAGVQFIEQNGGGAGVGLKEPKP